MKRRYVALIAITLALLLAACGSGGSSASATASAGSRTIDVTMSDDLAFDHDTFTVSAGEKVTFRVHNAGQTIHEFYIGDEEAQADHEAVMAEMGMAHGDESGIAVDPGATGSLEYTFADPGELLIGCHEPGHYAGGMRATVKVEP
jgi:uncharacterized cupredoxin-like copper-binding protein